MSVDTTRLKDGAHQVSITIKDRNGEPHIQEHFFRVSNWNVLKAGMSKPLASSRFADFDLDSISSLSDGWAFADHPETLFADSGRRVRSGAKADFLIWEVPNLTSYAVTLYVAESAVGRLAELLGLAVSASASPSPDEGQWLQLRYVQTTGGSEGGWLEVSISGEMPDLPKWFRLTLKEAATPDVVQVGEVSLTYRKWQSLQAECHFPALSQASRRLPWRIAGHPLLCYGFSTTMLRCAN